LPCVHPGNAGLQALAQTKRHIGIPLCIRALVRNQFSLGTMGRHDEIIVDQTPEIADERVDALPLG